jgi:glycosyltransferase involved in cell wall biosynthesis
LADELVFTNENQLVYMLDHVSDKRLKRTIEGKSIVRVHPTPPARSYEVLPSKYALSESVINVGYFGAFYENRGLHEVLTALSNVSPEMRRKLRLHVFTNNPDELARQIQEFGLVGVVKAQGYRPYLEFLNLCRKFDVLLVNDVERSGELSINPFLPSKYSDYKGAGVPIWGLIDEGSALSREPLAYSSRVGDGPGALAVLREIFGTAGQRTGMTL